MITFPLLLLLALSPQAGSPTPAAPASAEAGHALADCTAAKPGRPCKIVIDRLAPVSGRSIKVENRTEVLVVLIKKSPFESCKNEVKREELPDVSAIPTLIGLIKELTPSLLLAAPAPGGQPDPGQQILALLDAIARAADAQADAAGTLQKDYETVTTALKNFYRTRYLRQQYAGGAIKGEAEFETARAAVETQVTALVAKAVPMTAAGETTYKSVLALYANYLRSSAADPRLLPVFEQQINRARAALDALAKITSELQAAQVKMRSSLEYVKGLKDPDWEASVSLRPDINAKLTGSFSCTSDVSGKPSLDPPVAYSVTYQNTPRLSLTAGILTSTVPRNAVGVEPVLDERAADGTPTSHTEVRDHPSRPQAVPFSFVNIRLGSPWRWRERLMTFNLTPGLGLNPNNGATHAEFFLGLALGFDSFFVAGGVHAGHELAPANGFKITDRVAGDFTVPVDTPWKPGVGISVSYRIPLK